jgi:hypothetical protein
MTRQLLSRSRSQLCAELEYDVWNFCSLNPFRLNQGLRALFRAAFDRRFRIRRDKYSTIFNKADKRLSKLVRRRRSYFGNILILKKKIRFFFGYLTKTEMIRRVAQMRNVQTKNKSFRTGFDNLFRVFEMRLDFMSIRLRYVFNLKQARPFVELGNLAVNGVRLYDPAFIVHIGDIVGPGTMLTMGSIYKSFYYYWFGEYILKSRYLKARFLRSFFQLVLFKFRKNLVNSIKNYKLLYRAIKSKFRKGVWYQYHLNKGLNPFLNRVSFLNNFLYGARFAGNTYLHNNSSLIFLINKNKESLNMSLLFKLNSTFSKLKDLKLPSNFKFTIRFRYIKILRLFYICYFLEDYLKELESEIERVLSYYKFFNYIKFVNRIKNDFLFNLYTLVDRRSSYMVFKLIFTLSCLLAGNYSILNFDYNKAWPSKNFHSPEVKLPKYNLIFLHFKGRIDKILLKISIVRNNLVISTRKFIVDHFKEDADSNLMSLYAFSSLLRFLKRNTAFKKFLYNKFFYMYKISRNISLGFFLVMLRLGVVTRLRRVSLAKVYFRRRRRSLSLWSISNIEQMYYLTEFLYKTSKRRVPFFRIKSRKYSYFLFASKYKHRKIFFRRFKRLSNRNLVLFLFSRFRRRIITRKYFFRRKFRRFKKSNSLRRRVRRIRKIKIGSRYRYYVRRRRFSNKNFRFFKKSKYKFVKFFNMYFKFFFYNKKKLLMKK